MDVVPLCDNFVELMAEVSYDPLFLSNLLGVVAGL